MSNDFDEMLERAKDEALSRWGQVNDSELIPSDEDKKDPTQAEIDQVLTEEFDRIEREDPAFFDKGPPKTLEQVAAKIRSNIEYYREHEQAGSERANSAVGALEEILEYISPRKSIEIDRDGELEFTDRRGKDVTVKSIYTGYDHGGSVDINGIVFSRDMLKELVPYLSRFAEHGFFLPKHSLILDEDTLYKIWLFFSSEEELLDWLNEPNDLRGGRKPIEMSPSQIVDLVQEERGY